MRVTDRMLYDRATNDSSLARSRMEQAIAQNSTGARFVHPGEDPAAAGLVAVERARASRLDTIATTAQRASDELTAADSALSDVANGIARAREIATQLSNATYSASERAEGATEVRGILASAIASLNVKVGDRYVLAGRADQTKPFDAAGNYLADAGAREVEIAPGVTQAASVRADVAVKGVGGGVDVLATLTTLANALDANDAAAVSATLDALSAGTGQISEARAQAGTAMATFDAALAANQAGRDGAKKAVSSLADADPIKAASDLSLAERALDAALTATSQGFQLTLLDKLK